MKPFYHRTDLLITLFFISLLVARPLFAGDLQSQKGLLWQVDKPLVMPSYLFGTIHSEDPRVKHLPHLVCSIFENANSVSFELLMDIPTILKASSAMFFTGNMTLDQLIEPALFTKIVKALRRYKMPLRVVKRLKPWAVMTTLNMPPSKTGKFLDLLLYEKAQILKKPIYGLEKIEEQLAIFEEMSLEEQIFLLKETLKKLNRMQDMFDKLHKLYLQRDLTALMVVSVEYTRNSRHKRLVKAFYKRILDDRNIKMVKKMEKRLQEGNAFIAIGALHLPGKNGVLQLLQIRGYRVEALY